MNRPLPDLLATRYQTSSAEGIPPMRPLRAAGLPDWDGLRPSFDMNVAFELEYFADAFATDFLAMARVSRPEIQTGATDLFGEDGADVGHPASPDRLTRIAEVYDRCLFRGKVQK